MANKTFNVRICNKYDTLEQYQESNIILLKGEMALVQISTTQTDENGKVVQVPCIMAKIGNGTDGFNALPWLSGLSANSYAWALAPNKPSYTAEEITDLDEFISKAVEDKNTQYRIVADEEDASKLYLQSTEDASAEEPTWTTVSTFNSTKVEAGDTAGTIKVNGTDVPLTGWSTLQTQVTNNTTAIETLNGSDTTEGSVANTVKTATDTLKTELESQIATQISSTYKAAGSLAPTALTEDLLVKANEGNVYNVNAAFSSSDLFIEGDGKSYPIGTNVVVVETTDEAGETVYRFDVLAGFVNLLDYATKDEVEEALSGLDLGDIGGTITTDKISNFTTQVETVVKEQLTAPAEGGETPEILQTVESIASEKAAEAINALDNTDAEVVGQYVVEAKESDGIVSVKRAAVDIAYLVQNTEDTIVLSAGNASA